MGTLKAALGVLARGSLATFAAIRLGFLRVRLIARQAVRRGDHVGNGMAV
jgi:hypothetical protein